MKDDLSISQRLVFDRAKAILEKKSWYRGVCMDNFPSSEYCFNKTDEAVQSVIMETAMWDELKS